MRHADPSVRYLVGTPKGRLTKLEKDLATKDWQQVKDDVHVKLLHRDGELYVLARSLPRRGKDPTTDTLVSAQTIEGSGTIDVLLNNTAGHLVDANVNGGVLSLNQDTANHGVLQASGGGTLNLNGNIEVSNTGALITALSGSTVNLNNSTITGGTINNAGGTINANGSNTLDGSGSEAVTLVGRYSIASNKGTTLKGTISNTGVIGLDGGPSYGANLSIDGSVDLQGPGKVTLSDSGNNAIRSSNPSGADTLNCYQTIEGSGTIDVIYNNKPGQTVNANVPGASLTLNQTTTNDGTLQASNGGTLHVNGGGSGTGTITSDAGSEVVFNGGNFILAQGSEITGAGQTRIAAGTVNIGAYASDTIQATNLTVAGGTLAGPGALQISGNLTWTGGTIGGSGTTTVANGATLQIGTPNTNTLATASLVNNGTATWSGGTIAASDGAQFVNNGSLGVTGYATFSISDTGVKANFINNGNLSVLSSASLLINGDFANDGSVVQGGSGAGAAIASFSRTAAAGGSVTVTGNVTGKGAWTIGDTVLNILTLGIHGYIYDRTVDNSITATGSQAHVNVTDSGTATFTAPLTITDSAKLTAPGATVVLNAPAVISHNGSAVISHNGSAVISHNGSADISTGGSLITQDGAGVMVAGTLVAHDGGTLVSNGGSSLVAQGGGNVVIIPGANASASVSSTTSALRSVNMATTNSATVSSIFTGPVILAENGGNIIGMTGGTFTGNMVAQSGGSILPGGAGAVGIMTLNGGLDLQTGSFLKMDLTGLAQGVSYDLLNVAGSVAFNGNLLLNMPYSLRSLASSNAFTIVTANSPIAGTIGNLIGNRVFEQDGYGSFQASYGTNNNLVLNDFEAAPLSYPLWQTAWNFADTSDEDFNATPADDGIPNGIKYALGLDPLAQAADLLPIVSILNVSGTNYLALTYVRPTGVNAPADLVCEVERSTDLTLPGGGWSSSGVVQQAVTPGPDAGYETVVMRSSTPVGAPGITREYLHLKVTKP